jgi:hypothetical protein
VPDERERAARVMRQMESILGPTLGFGGDPTGGAGSPPADGSGSAAPPPAGGSPTTGTTAASSSGLRMGGAKLAAVVAATFAAGAGVGAAVDRNLWAQPPVAAATVYLPAPPLPHGSTEDANPLLPTPPPTGVVATVSVATASAANPGAHGSARPEASAAPASNLARERSLIDAARAGIARDHAGAALEALRRHELEFPRGQLREERDAIRILALAGQGRRTEARALATRFNRTYPQSVFVAQIDAALEAP